MPQTTAHKKTREAFAETVIELAQRDPRIVFVSADCGAKEREYFRTEGRGRLIETGIAEANSAVVAAGLAAEGFRPYVLNFAYLLGRMYNQISQSICEDAYNVKLAAYYAGIWGTGGRSHNCVTDVGLMRTLPNLSIFAPADYWETKAVIRHLDALDGPTYVRLAGVPTPLVYEREPDFQPLRRLTEGDHCTIFCHGTSVYEALQANRLGSLRAAVVDVARLKPLPAAEILCEAQRTRRVVVVEEHSVIGGLGETIAALLAQHDPMPMRLLGVRDQFALSVLMDGPGPEEIYRFYGISCDDIIRAAQGLMEGHGRHVAEVALGEPAR
jgi:transketolase